jgi:hypothetical protein
VVALLAQKPSHTLPARLLTGATTMIMVNREIRSIRIFAPAYQALLSLSLEDRVELLKRKVVQSLEMSFAYLQLTYL